jgi:hypothetical protein
MNLFNFDHRNYPMKPKQILILLFIASAFNFSCSKDGDETISGILEYNMNGDYQFTLDAKNITANITIIAGGGGGGGGVDYDKNVITPQSTGGGGGGGAGEVISLTNVSLTTDSTYIVVVGHGGQGGTKGFPGLKGKNSTISIGGTVQYEANAGSGGASNSINQFNGGGGGTGFPNGDGGSKGVINNNGLADPGNGGAGGNNGTAFGAGGDGGDGTRLVATNVPQEAESGVAGLNGYIRIEWTGIQ